jgi:hypothetical protein
MDNYLAKLCMYKNDFCTYQMIGEYAPYSNDLFINKFVPDARPKLQYMFQFIYDNLNFYKNNNCMIYDMSGGK